MKVIIRENIISVYFAGKIDYRIPANFTIPSAELPQKFQILELNFERAKFVTLPGAMFILFIVSTIVSTKKKRGINLETRISGLNEPVLISVIDFGLLAMLKLFGGLRLDVEIEKLNNTRLQFWKKDIKKTTGKLTSLYWPISLIPQRNGDNFQGELAIFMNNFTEYFFFLADFDERLKHYSEDIVSLRKSFISVVNEACKNVWDHSESWGAASIYSHSKYKSTFCLFDRGVGFINSYIKRKGQYERNTVEDIKTLEWLFDEGNTSDAENNHGRGLARIAKFVDLTKGILVIKTDKYLMEYSSTKGLKVTESFYFPGAQIMINF